MTEPGPLGPRAQVWGERRLLPCVGGEAEVRRRQGKSSQGQADRNFMGTWVPRNKVMLSTVSCLFGPRGFLPWWEEWLP